MAQSANEALRDALIRHQTYLLRYSSFVRNRIWSILAKSEDEIGMRIRDKLANSTGLKTPQDLKRLATLLESIERLRKTSWAQATEEILNEMTTLALQEPSFFAGIIGTVSPVIIETALPAPRLLRAIVTSRPFEGRLLKDWAASMEADDLRRIRSAIQLGMVAGESSVVIARRVVGTDALKGTDGTVFKSFNQVQAITRTAVQHVANNARAEFLNENAEVIAAELFVATLDGRTTPVCRAYDGKQFPLNAGPRPPLHISCRSLRVAAMDGEQLGKRPSKPTTERLLVREFSEKNGLGNISSRVALPRGTKSAYDDWARKRVRELVGRVPAATSYQEWLKAQTKTFQDDTLGVAKAKLFRDGGLTLDKFVAADGTELSLSQLASKHAEVFRAAGLDPKTYL